MDLEYARLLRSYQSDPSDVGVMRRIMNMQSRLAGPIPDIDKAIANEVEKRVANRPRRQTPCPPCPENRCPEPAPCPPCPKPPPCPVVRCPLPPPCPICPTPLDGFKETVFNPKIMVPVVLLGGGLLLYGLSR